MRNLAKQKLDVLYKITNKYIPLRIDHQAQRGCYGYSITNNRSSRAKKGVRI